MLVETEKQIKWFVFELLRIRTNPNFVDGKYGSPIIFDMKLIEICENPYFKFTEFKTPLLHASMFLDEIRGYYASKKLIDPENSGLKFLLKDENLKIYGYTTVILKSFLKEELNCLPSIFNVYKKNNKFYILFINDETNVEITGDLLTAFRLLHQKCGDENIYTDWKTIFEKINIRRNIDNGLPMIKEKQVDYVYQLVSVKLSKLLKRATNDTNYKEDIIIDHKYGGKYRLTL